MISLGSQSSAAAAPNNRDILKYVQDLREDADLLTETVALLPKPPVFNAERGVGAFQETASAFNARLKRSNLHPQKVTSDGECFWTSALIGLNNICRANLIYSHSVVLPTTSLIMRNQVLDFMSTHLHTEWDQLDPYLEFLNTFIVLITDELPTGVLNGRTNLITYPGDIEEWFTLMRDRYAYTSTVCIFATALHFRVSLKIFIRGSETEAYVPRRELGQDLDDMHIVHPDSTICMCKGDRSSHFDACIYEAPSIFVPNLATKTGRGRERQARHKSSTEYKRNRK
jgi:hypothetical protein